MILWVYPCKRAGVSSQVYESEKTCEFVHNNKCLFELFLDKKAETCQLDVASVCFSDIFTGWSLWRF